MRKSVYHILALLALAPILAFSQQVTAQEVPTSKAQIQLTFAPIVKKVSPAVVNIYTKRKEMVQQQVASPFANDPFFRQFFGGQMAVPGPMKERVTNSLGSGVIIGKDGTIVTSNHVIKGADQISVVLTNDREYEAKVTRLDAGTDLAFLKIEAKEPLPVLEMRDSDTLEVGELVLAVGNPFGVGQTVTQGIVSGLARKAKGVNDYQFFIQTDAAINPGNSGGALVDLNGMLVGINTAIYSTSGGSIGIGFAIPTNVVKAALASEVKSGQIVRPWVGIAAQPLTRDIAESLGLDVPHGALVAQVAKGSPAERAGIKSGDVLTAVNGATIKEAGDFQYRLSQSKVGDTVQATYLRGGKTQTVSMKLEATPVIEAKTKMLKGAHPLDGVVVIDLADLKALVDNPAELPQKGVAVIDASKATKPGGNALQRGDVLLQVNGVALENVAQLEGLLNKKPRAWQLIIQRGPAVLTINIKP